MKVEGHGAARLVVTDALGRRIIPVDKPLLTFGRRTECDVRLSGGDVSRQHAELAFENGVATLRDCGSKFGTFVNGEQITERVLKSGDALRFGRTEDMQMVYLVGEHASTVEKSAVSAASELRHMAALLDGLRALGSGRVLDEVLALVLDSAIEVAGAERGFIMLANQDRQLEFKMARSRGKVTLSGKTFETSRKIPEEVFATGEQRIVEDLLDANLAQLHTGTVALGIRHVLCTPLRLVRYVEKAEQRGAEEIIGVLYLDSRERGALKSEAARTALDTLSAEAALAIENARLYREAMEKAKFEQELRVAAGIQQALLPPASRAGAFYTTAALSVPCRSVGGDFFDYVDLPNGQFGFILGDVAGKGSPAALLAAAALGMFSAEATYQGCASPVLAKLNKGIFRRNIDARYLTAFYGILSPDGKLLYTNAGHNAPVMITTSGEVRRLEAGGTVLGLFEAAAYTEERLQVSAGDILVLYSDGVTEALNMKNEEFGDERLISALQEARGAAPQAILDHVLAQLRAFCADAIQTDDITMVLVRFGN